MIKYVIFRANGRLGNALFRYFACILFSVKHGHQFILEEDCNNEKLIDYIFYKGVDHIGDDKSFFKNDNINKLKDYANKNNEIICFNTLGFMKSSIDIHNLKSNEYINQNNDHGLYVKNTIIIDDNNFINMVNDNNLKNYNLLMVGYFQFDYIYNYYKKDILSFINNNSHNHFIRTATYNRILVDNHQKMLIRNIINDIQLDEKKVYDLVIHVRLGDFVGRDDFIEYEYYEKLFEKIDFSNKKCAIITQKPESDYDILFLNKCILWFNSNNITIHLEYNDLITDFNIMKSAKEVVCSMSTLSWCACYLSKNIEQCYMPNYNFDHLDRSTYFKNPINNTYLYDVKSTLK
jgi:hypothetical protein